MSSNNSAPDRMKLSTSSLALILLIVLSGCKTIEVKDTEVCAVAGTVLAGADCVHTLTDERRSMTFDEFIEWLEPQETPERGPAICQSSQHFNEFKTTLEIACRKLGKRCTYDIKKIIERTSALEPKKKKKAKK